MRRQNFLSENPKSQLLLITDVFYPRFRVTFGGNDAFREPTEIDVETFVGVKGFRAKGKRITTLTLASIEELEPLRQPEPKPEAPEEDPADTAEEHLPSLFDKERSR